VRRFADLPALQTELTTTLAGWQPCGRLPRHGHAAQRQQAVSPRWRGPPLGAARQRRPSCDRLAPAASGMPAACDRLAPAASGMPAATAGPIRAGMITAGPTRACPDAAVPLVEPAQIRPAERRPGRSAGGDQGWRGGDWAASQAPLTSSSNHSKPQRRRPTPRRRGPRPECRRPLRRETPPLSGWPQRPHTRRPAKERSERTAQLPQLGQDIDRRRQQPHAATTGAAVAWPLRPAAALPGPLGPLQAAQRRAPQHGERPRNGLERR
jgi:hypothetical protein